ncbi:multidrug effflux MFS transporter [Streptomyces sp. AK02-01A]|uniref:multidrug effflux MFS transporter n=1 Tax=Streptomyces sp. AK02-01A TaxID=3028648 RepID=UPI0029A090EF|nr:multidrug effflux MFS transporter [Streptomyces sp. AK02-01A]MDX3855493.1 multidrug effflux MFS transporter [Streptomyces sp. AK02-01A]
MSRLTAALVLLCFVGPLSTDMYLPAFPRMAVELGTDASGVQLTLTAFLVGMTLGHLVFGPLSDRYGRRGPLLAGAAVCAVATTLCAVAPSPGWLIVLRFAAGFSGAAGVVIGRAVISDVAEGAAAARLFAVLMTLSGLAPVLAPLAGGAVIGVAGWRGVFWGLGGVALLAVLVVVAAVPESLPKARRRTGGGRELLRAARDVVSDGAYVGYTLTFAFAFGALFCYIAGSPFLLQNVLGLSVGASSVAFSGGAVVAALSGATTARLVGRVAPERLLRIGLYAVATAPVTLLAVTLAGALTVAVCLPLVALMCGGLGLVFANAASLAIARVPASAGTGSALLGTAQSALGAVVAPLVGMGGGDTAVPVFMGMALCAVLAAVAAAVAGRRARDSRIRTLPRGPGHAAAPASTEAGAADA